MVFDSFDFFHLLLALLGRPALFGLRFFLLLLLDDDDVEEDTLAILIRGKLSIPSSPLLLLLLLPPPVAVELVYIFFKNLLMFCSIVRALSVSLCKCENLRCKF